MVVNNFKCSSFFSFLPLHISRFSFSCFPSSVHLWHCFVRMFTIRCHCAIIRHSAQLPSHCNCRLNSSHFVLSCARSPLLALQVSFTLRCGSNSVPAVNPTFFFPIKEGLPFQQRIIK